MKSPRNIILCVVVLVIGPVRPWVSAASLPSLSASGRTSYRALHCPNRIPEHYRTRRRRPVSGVAHTGATQLAEQYSSSPSASSCPTRELASA